MTLVTGLCWCVICKGRWDIKTHWHVRDRLTYNTPVAIWHLRNDAIRSHHIQTKFRRPPRERSFFTVTILIVWCMYSSGLAAFVNWHIHITHPPHHHLSGARIYTTYQYNLQPFGSTYLAIKVSFKAKFQIDTFTARWPLMPSFFNQMHMWCFHLL